ncbi:MAG: hypothetical protein AABW88_01770, partial [Nanoarchaeota archaeon]
MKEIIGDGDIAKVLKDVDKDVLFFASGVSNSKEERESEFKREADLLNKQKKDKHLVYFSSLATFEKESPYYLHKRIMEQLVKTFPHHTIVRLGNITFGSNPNTLINGLKNKIKNGETLEIRDEYRYIV